MTRGKVSELGIQTLMNMIWKSDLNINKVIPKEEEIWGGSIGNKD